MIRIIKKIPHEVTVACSGGIDSMVFTHFLLQGRKKVNLAYFNHDTMHSYHAQTFVENYAKDNSLDLSVGKVKGKKGKRSMEEFWRDERYGFLNSLEGDYIMTCHHLDDCLETWIMAALHGRPKLIPFHRAPNIYRPFLMTTKKVIRKYAKDKDLSWEEDPSNSQTGYMRNHVRHNLISQALVVNPGARTMIRKKLVEKYL